MSNKHLRNIFLIVLSLNFVFSCFVIKDTAGEEIIPQLEWETDLGSGYTGEPPICVREALAGNYKGFIISAFNKDEGWKLIRTDETGISTWENTIPFIGTINPSYHLEIAQNKKGTIAVTVTLSDSRSLGSILFDDETGDIIDKKTYIDSFCEAHSIDSLLDGSFVVTGYELFKSKFHIIRTNTNGDLVKNIEYNVKISNQGVHSCIKHTSDGGYIIVINSNEAETQIVKFNSKNNIEWEKVYSKNSFERGFYIAPSNDGYFIACARHYVVKIDDRGNIQWNKSTDSLNYSVSSAKDGGCVLALGTLVKFNSDGEWEWSINNKGYYNYIIQTSDGGFVAVGRKGYGSDKLILTKFSTLQPKLYVEPKEIDLGTVEQGDDALASFEITNIGTGTLEGTIEESESEIEIRLSVDEFYLNEGENIEVEATILNTEELSPDYYNYELYISSNGGDETILISFELIVEETQSVEVSTSELDFGVLNKGDKDTLSFEITNTGNKKAECYLETTADWINLSQYNFELDEGETEKIKVTVDTTNLESDKYFEYIFIFSQNDYIEVEVILEVRGSKPILSVAPTRIVFPKTYRGTNIKSSFEVLNSGSGELEGKIKVLNEWIKVSNNSFNSNYILIEITVDTTLLQEEKNTGTILIESNGGTTKIEVYVELATTVIELWVGNDMVLINGEPFVLDIAPFIDKSSGRTMVPLRLIAEAFGASVSWDSTTYEVRIEHNNKTIILIIGLKIYVLNGITYKMDVAPTIKNGRTFVPIRFISEALDAEVQWDSYEQKVTIRL